MVRKVVENIKCKIGKICNLILYNRRSWLYIQDSHLFFQNGISLQ